MEGETMSDNVNRQAFTFISADEAAGDSAPPAPATVATGGGILLVCASRHGSTWEVADAVAGELRAAGHAVDVRKAAAAPGPDG